MSDKPTGRCDCCDKPATVIMTTDNCPYCAAWFVGHYCQGCFSSQAEECQTASSTQRPHIPAI